MKPLIDIEELNPRFLFWLGLIILFAVIGLYPLIITQPDTTPVNVTIPVQIVYRDVIVTPTPDGIKYFANEYQSGVRKLNHPFSWIRYNATGNQNMKITANVYNYMFFDKLNYFNPTDYKYYLLEPTNENNKYLFVFFVIWQDDEVFDDTRFWLPSKNMFAIQIADMLYAPLTYPEELRFKELENTYTYNDDSKVKPYGSYRSYSFSEGLQNAGEISVKEYYLKGGKSNAQDGYIIFEIPKGVSESDITFRANFFSFGSSAWKFPDSKVFL